MPCPDLEYLTAHGPTAGLVLLVLEWLIVAVFVGRKSRKRIADRKKEQSMTTPTFEQQLQMLYNAWVAFSEYSHNPEKTDGEVIEQEVITDEVFRDIFKISHPDGLPPNRRRK